MLRHDVQSVRQSLLKDKLTAFMALSLCRLKEKKINRPETLIYFQNIETLT